MNNIRYVNICTRRPNWNGCGWLNEHPENSFSLCHNQNKDNACPGCMRITEKEASEKGFVKIEQEAAQ